MGTVHINKKIVWSTSNGDFYLLKLQMDIHPCN